MKPTNSVYTGLPTTIFEEMSRLAIANKAVNLGQGFPDVDGPEDIRRKAAEALIEGPNQYPPMMGVMALREAVAANWKRFHGLDVDPAREVLVTSGATEALSDAINAIVEPGDEVVLIEPLYDCYLPLVKRAGGVPKLVRVTPPDWALDEAALAQAFSPRTKAVLLNNPQNPAAKVYSRDELQLIADLVIRHDAYVIADEVYEHIVFDGARHVSMLSLEGMRERTRRNRLGRKELFADRLEGRLRDGGAGAARSDREGAPVHHLHHAARPAEGGRLRPRQGRELFQQLGRRPSGEARPPGERLRGARDGRHPLPGHLLPDPRHEPLGLDGDDAALAKRMTVEAGVASVPVSAFYVSDAPKSYLRLCFSKRDEVLDEAVERMGRWLKSARRTAA